MPLYRADHVEYHIESGHITIIMDKGVGIPAYWAHPTRGQRFPGVALVHNWWGITDVVRRMANLFAQMGFYVVVPDLFRGSQPGNVDEALIAVKKLGDAGYDAIDGALSVLETHHMCSGQVAAVGIGMGGGLVYEAAIKRHDLEVAVAFYGFPQAYLGKFGQAQTPIMGIYGEQDKIIRPVVVDQLRAELAQSPLRDQHKIVTIPGAGHDFVVDKPKPDERYRISRAWQTSLDFIETYIQPPQNTDKRQVM